MLSVVVVATCLPTTLLDRPPEVAADRYKTVGECMGAACRYMEGLSRWVTRGKVRRLAGAGRAMGGSLD